MTLPVDGVTVIIPTSPIPSHPDTAIIEATLSSVRDRLPDAQIIITADGLRPEQEQRRAVYDAYLARLGAACNAGRYGSAWLLTYPEFLHQSGMLRSVLHFVGTPTVFYVEHDMALTGELLPWNAMVDAVVSKKLDVIRLAHETHVLPVHEYLMLDRKPFFVGGVPVIRTVQWSQRPHLARTEWYRGILEAFFPPDSRTMIEDRFYGIVEMAAHDLGMHAGWAKYRLGIYAPDGSMLRCVHTDGRADDEKYPMDFGGHG